MQTLSRSSVDSSDGSDIANRTCTLALQDSSLARASRVLIYRKVDTVDDGVDGKHVRPPRGMNNNNKK
jgi:hypothetical protein